MLATFIDEPEHVSLLRGWTAGAAISTTGRSSTPGASHCPIARRTHGAKWRFGQAAACDKAAAVALNRH